MLYAGNNQKALKFLFTPPLVYMARSCYLSVFTIIWVPISNIHISALVPTESLYIWTFRIFFMIISPDRIVISRYYLTPIYSILFTHIIWFLITIFITILYSHGASVADLDENSMFYLAARGIDRRVRLCTAFFCLFFYFFPVKFIWLQKRISRTRSLS